MSFLTPAFVAGLGLLLVPILIHLTQRQRSEVTAFPSLMFLRRVPFKTSDRRRIRHPLLFALRCLALALLALAFMRPFTRGGEEGSTGSRDVLLLLDTSASLAYGDRWAAASDAAAGILDGLAEGDRAGLVAFSERAREIVSPTSDVAAVRAALERLEPGETGTRLEAGLQLAGRILAESDRSAREVVLISDFQRSGWEDAGRVRLPDGVTLTPISLAADGDANLAVADARFSAEADGRIRVVARIANMGADAVGDVPVTLELGGRTVGTRRAEIGPRGAATVAFEDVPLPGDGVRGSVSVPSDALAVDDALRFLAAPDPALEVLVLEGSRGRPDRSLYVERALGVGEAPRVRSTRRAAAALDPGWLAGAGAVIVNDAGLGRGATAARLRTWVEDGGGLLLALGSNADPESWSEDARALLGGTPGPVQDRTAAGGVRLAWLDYDHPVFELFSAPRSGDFSEARFFRFQGIEPAGGTSVLARFEGGEPALLEHALGEGRVLVWTSTLDRFWNDLALQPVFVPFVHRAIRHLTRYREPERWVTAGGVKELGALVGTAGREGGWVLVTPDGDRRPIDIAGAGPTWIPFERTGFYRIEPLEDGGAGVTVAVNAALPESDLAPVAPERVVEAVVGAAAGAESATATAAAAGEVGPESRRELWWPVLLLAILVLGVESVVANRWARRRAPRHATAAEG